MGCRKEREEDFQRANEPDDGGEDIFAASHYGFTEEQLDNPREALLSGGLKEFFNARHALAARAIKKWGRAPLNNAPAWQNLSGLTPEAERSAPRDEREAMIADFLRGVTKLIRHEIYKEKTRWVQQNEINALKNGRTRHWDPIRSVCFQLEIAQNKLSSYSKEVIGMSASEIVDCIRAEAVRPALKIALRKFVAEFFAYGGADSVSRKGAKTQRGGRGETEGRGNAGTGGRQETQADGKMNSTEQQTDVAPWHPTVADEVFRALKLSRREGRFHRTTRANELGFSSHTRFFRACLKCYGKTPQELELELIEEILSEADLVSRKDTKAQSDGRGDVESGRRGEDAVSEVEIVRRE